MATKNMLSKEIIMKKGRKDHEILMYRYILMPDNIIVEISSLFCDQ